LAEEEARVSTRTEAVLFLGRCLSYDESASAVADLRRSLSRDRIDWIAVVDIANRHGVSPALWLALKRKALTDSLPGDLQDYLVMLHDLNCRRNRLIREQAIEALSALTRRGLCPILMKGGISLFEDGVDDGLCMMSDVDILLEESELAAASAALNTLGYFLFSTPPSHAHAWTFYRPMSLATIDLHKHVGPQRDLLRPMAARDAAVPFASREGALHALSPTHRAQLLLMTFGIFERHYRNGHIPLKGLHDLAALCSRHADKIDWDAITKQAELYRFDVSAQAFLHMAHHILAVPPPVSLSETRASRRYLRRCLLQLALPPFEQIMRFWTYLTWPFDRFRMDYRYGCGLRGLDLQLARLQHAAGILARHNPLWLRQTPGSRSGAVNGSGGIR
jgi:putative nucleotidyltransferase-like protein